MIAIIDYGVGNLFSLSASLRHIGVESAVTRDLARLEAADKIILPGVGAFGDAADRLRETGLFAPLKALAGQKPLLGICLGMQLLFEEGFEYGSHQGLGLIHGQICHMAADIKGNLKVPQIGWNALCFQKPQDPLLRYIYPGDCVYFVHSYYARDCAESLVATTEYGVTVPALVREGNVWGAQFHPEKSGQAGLNILRAFAEV